MVALVTREVMQQLRQDRAAAPPPTTGLSHARGRPCGSTSRAVPSSPGWVVSRSHRQYRYRCHNFPAPGGGHQWVTDVHISTDALHCTGCHPVRPRQRHKGMIWADECVNIYELTNPLQFQPQQVSFASGSQIVSPMPQPSKGRQICTIEQWTSAFLVFEAIYTQRFSNFAPDMFIYSDIVRDIAVTGPLLAWRQYDEQFRQFRQFRQSDPVTFPWDQPRTSSLKSCTPSKSRGFLVVLQPLLSIAFLPATLSDRISFGLPAGRQMQSVPVRVQAYLLQMPAAPSFQFVPQIPPSP